MIKIVKSKRNGEASVLHLIGKVYHELYDLELYFDKETANYIKTKEHVAVFLYEYQNPPTIIYKGEYEYV